MPTASDGGDQPPASTALTGSSSNNRRNPDQYIKTTKEVINYVGQTYIEYTVELTQAVRDLAISAPTAPVNPDPANIVAFALWKIDVKEHRVKEQEYVIFNRAVH